MKLISFIGIERADFAYYISASLKALKTTVLVIDNSVSGDLFNSVTRNDKDSREYNVVEFQNIAFVRGLAYNKETFDKFDYVVCYNGWGPVDTTVLESDYVYVMPDYRMDNLDLAKKALADLSSMFDDNAEEETADKVSVIMRDLVSEKITDASISRYVNISEERIIGHITMDPIDFERQIAFEYNGRQKVKGSSADYVDAMAYVLMQTTGKSDKVVKKLLKKA